MRFLYELQNKFYDRYVKAIRDTGYDGEILGSNWQAGRAFSHYYNLHSDSRVGMIDRHNYFGGGSKGTINNASMLRIPGSGMLSAGMQQVANRPFMLSEWIHVWPNEWGVEGPAIIGAYGMGLQGWDVSYMFQNRDIGGFSPSLGGHNWDVTAPQVFGIFPAVSRQVLRGDVKESSVVAKRYVHIPSFIDGKIGFEDEITQQYDVKTFDSDKVPVETLAGARCVVVFTDEYRETPKFNLKNYMLRDIYISEPRQLWWKKGDSKHSGYFTIHTPGTKAYIGFQEKGNYTSHQKDQVTILPKSQFAAIYVTSLESDKDIQSSNNLLITAIARARNTGMKVSETGDKLLEKGTAPVLMEPVQAVIEIKKPGNPTVYVLDHDGLMTNNTIPVKNGKIEIDGSRDKSPYYLVKYDE
jgi:hypothetical protein